MFDQTITLFNYHAKSECWRSVVFTGADVVASKSLNATQQGLSNSDSVDILLNAKVNNGIILCCGIPYAKPKEYAMLDDPIGCFTFTPEQDFIIVGDYHTDEPVLEGDYIDGFYTEMNAEHDDVYMISSVSYFSLMPHFEAGGR